MTDVIPGEMVYDIDADEYLHVVQSPDEELHLQCEKHTASVDFDAKDIGRRFARTYVVIEGKPAHNDRWQRHKKRLKREGAL